MRVTKTSTNSPERRNIVNAARLTTGYIYFELSDYRRTIQYMSQIASDFYDHPDALLAKGWAEYKINDYQAALATLGNLREQYSDYYNLEEANFIMGQCFLKLGYYNFAISQYERIIEETPAPEQVDLEVSRGRLAAHERKLEKLKTKLLALESNLLSMIPMEQSEVLIYYVGDQKQPIQERRKDLMAQIYSEREALETLRDEITLMRRRIEKTEMQKDWQAYAEYGKARALYLKGIAME